MAHYNFSKDLPMGENAQLEAIERIKKEFKNIAIVDGQLKTNEYDIKGMHNSKQITFEVKWDIKAAETGNVAIEYHSRGKPSGIAVSKADYWIYKIGNAFYLIETGKLKEALLGKIFHADVTGGDPGSNTKMYLVKFNVFISLGKKI